MQTDTTTEKAALFTDFPPALPPAKSCDEMPVTKKKRKIKAGILLRAVCLLTALSIITLASVKKIIGIIDKGALNYLGNAFIEFSIDTIGDNVSTIAFGKNEIPQETVKTTEEEEIPLPAISYIPLEEITNKILEDEKARNEKLAALYTYNTTVPSGMYPIIPTDSSADSPLKLKNDTSFKIDMEKISSSADKIEPVNIGAQPLVLIVHTHGTESFADKNAPYYNDTVNYPRSEDVSKNIVAVGKVLCDTLSENGIPTIHCEIMHDKDSYINAYDRTAESIQSYIEKYPSIQYIFDVHRDSLIRSDLVKLRPVTLVGDSPCAQIMMIVGSNEKGAGDYAWQDNLVLATAIQKNLFSDARGVARQLNLRGATYNQQYAKHGILVEIGSCGNTLEEAKLAAKVFGNAFAKVINGG